MAPRCRLNFQQKKIICQFSADNPTMSQADLVYHFNTKWNTTISKSLLSLILSNRVRWLATTDGNSDQLSIRGGAYKDLEDVLFHWYTINGLADISGIRLQEKAAHLAQEPRFGVSPYFKFSNGWLDSFKLRYKIILRHKRRSQFDIASSKGAEDFVVNQDCSPSSDISHVDQEGPPPGKRQRASVYTNSKLTEARSSGFLDHGNISEQ